MFKSGEFLNVRKTICYDKLCIFTHKSKILVEVFKSPHNELRITKITLNTKPLMLEHLLPCGFSLVSVLVRKH